MSELKPCPFCGGEARYNRKQISQGRVLVGYDCEQCGAAASVFTGPAAIEKSMKISAAKAWNRRAQQPDKPLTLFDKITESPEKLAKFLGAIDIGKIELDECFCKSDCGDDSGCPHELQCIINWLDKPEGSKKS